MKAMEATYIATKKKEAHGYLCPGVCLYAEIKATIFSRKKKEKKKKKSRSMTWCPPVPLY